MEEASLAACFESDSDSNSVEEACQASDPPMQQACATTCDKPSSLREQKAKALIQLFHKEQEQSLSKAGEVTGCAVTSLPCFAPDWPSCLNHLYLMLVTHNFAGSCWPSQVQQCFESLKRAPL